MARNESILDSVKLYSLVPEETSIYDAQIMDLINSQLNTVKQLGVGQLQGYAVGSRSDVWDDLGIEEPLLSAVVDYIKIAVNLKFDPPQNSYITNLRKEELDELTWRICNDYSCNEG